MDFEPYQLRFNIFELDENGHEVWASDRVYFMDAIECFRYAVKDYYSKVKGHTYGIYDREIGKVIFEFNGDDNVLSEEYLKVN